MSEAMAYLADNLAAVREDIRTAEERADRVGRTTLIAAVKYTDAEHIAELVRLGVRDLGENRVQQLTEHAQALEAMGVENVRFHFIGTLQRNKVKYLADRAVMIHSVDSLPLAEEIERQMAKRGKSMDILVEINSGGEASKSGVAPSEAAALCAEIARLPHLNLRGFMTMAPKCEKNEDYHKYFRETYKIGLDIWEKTLHNIGSPIFSMGMSASFPIAIEEGADLVRVGHRLFVPPEE
ncbi:MAG TPA: YggS family pyridoxal phosphate-dependent enzyme [Clostridiales bacterium]|nr:YggS family pyridoxal phosphate-dependent enzyme [Clostridiales bacterium]